MEWQPIATVPAEGEVLVYDRFWDTVVAARVTSIRGKPYFYPLLGGHDPDDIFEATHWMPLPSPPTP